MRNLFLILFTFALFLPCTISFLTAPPSTILNYTGRNLTCLGRTDTVYNGTTTYLYGSSGILVSNTGYNYCFIQIVTTLVNNSPKTITYRIGIWEWNMYRNIAVNQCNFSRTMDIGYGNCIPYYYENTTSMQVCICSTDHCSDTYSTCQTAVTQAISSPPPLLPVLQPTLSNIVICQDYYFNYSLRNNIVPPIYGGCQGLWPLGQPDSSKCSVYATNHTVICGVFYNAIIGSNQQQSMVEGSYEWWMYQTIVFGSYITYNISGFYQYETSTSIATIIPSQSGPYNLGICLCITNNCNVDFTTCTNGMNIPSYLLAYNNGSTSTASTGSTSSNANLSSSSTTPTTIVGSTSSSSRSIITTSRSSTTSAVTVSGISVANNNTSSYTTTLRSLSGKIGYSKLILFLSVSLFYVSNPIGFSQFGY